MPGFPESFGRTGAGELVTGCKARFSPGESRWLRPRTAVPEPVEGVGIAGEQIAITIGDAGHRPRLRAVSDVGFGLVGSVLPELPAAIGPCPGDLGLLAIVGQPEIAARQQRTGLHRLAQAEPTPTIFLAVGPLRMG